MTSSDLRDRTAPIRAGEEVDLARLGEYLREQLGEGGDLVVEQFPGGHSNLTYLIRLGDRELVLRRPPFGTQVKTAHDMGREYRVLSALGPVWDLVPTPLLLCEDQDVLGAPFYLMERVSGLILRSKVPAGLELGADTAHALCESFVQALAKLHDLDYEEVGLGDFGRPAGYVKRQVEGWTSRYDKARTDDIPDVDRVAEWLAQNLPDDDDDALIHNDFKFDNLVLDPDQPSRIVGILDWEMATVGHPLMDLGTSLAYWVEADDPPPIRMLPFGLTHLPGMMTRTEICERYAAITGMPIEAPEFYYAFGLWKTAVVAQQIYYRYKQGHTQDPRFEQMILGVRVLSAQAARALGS